MIEIRNLTLQPLVLQLAGDVESVHLRARQRRKIADESVSEEMLLAQERGFVLLQPVDEPIEEPAVTDSPEPAQQPENSAAVLVEPLLAQADLEAQALAVETTDAETATRKRR